MTYSIFYQKWPSKSCSNGLLSTYYKIYELLQRSIWLCSLRSELHGYRWMYFRVSSSVSGIGAERPYGKHSVR